MGAGAGRARLAAVEEHGKLSGADRRPHYFPALEQPRRSGVTGSPP